MLVYASWVRSFNIKNTSNPIPISNPPPLHLLTAKAEGSNQGAIGCLSAGQSNVGNICLAHTDVLSVSCEQVVEFSRAVQKIASKARSNRYTERVLQIDTQHLQDRLGRFCQEIPPACA